MRTSVSVLQETRIVLFERQSSSLLSAFLLSEQFLRVRERETASATTVPYFFNRSSAEETQTATVFVEPTCSTSTREQLLYSSVQYSREWLEDRAAGRGGAADLRGEVEARRVGERDVRDGLEQPEHEHRRVLEVERAILEPVEDHRDRLRAMVR